MAIGCSGRRTFLCFRRSALFRQNQKLEPLLSHPLPRLLLDRIRYLFCAFSRVFEVGSISDSVEGHGLHLSPTEHFGSAVRDWLFKKGPPFATGASLGRLPPCDGITRFGRFVRGRMCPNSHRWLLFN